MNSPRNLAKSLARYQSENGLGNTELAKKLEVSMSTLYKLKKGTEGFHSVTLDHIAEHMQTAPAILLTDPDEDWLKLAPTEIAHTAGVCAVLTLEERERAVYHFNQLVTLLRTGEERQSGRGGGR